MCGALCMSVVWLVSSRSLSRIRLHYPVAQTLSSGGAPVICGAKLLACNHTRRQFTVSVSQILRQPCDVVAGQCYNLTCALSVRCIWQCWLRACHSEHRNQVFVLLAGCACRPCRTACACALHLALLHANLPLKHN